MSDSIDNVASPSNVTVELGDCNNDSNEKENIPSNEIGEVGISNISIGIDVPLTGTDREQDESVNDVMDGVQTNNSDSEAHPEKVPEQNICEGNPTMSLSAVLLASLENIPEVAVDTIISTSSSNVLFDEESRKSEVDDTLKGIENVKLACEISGQPGITKDDGLPCKGTDAAGHGDFADPCKINDNSEQVTDGGVSVLKDEDNNCNCDNISSETYPKTEDDTKDNKDRIKIETVIKDEMEDAPDSSKTQESQQTRNLFETVGLALKSNSPSVTVTPSVTLCVTPSVTPSVTLCVTPSVSVTPSVMPSVTPCIKRTDTENNVIFGVDCSTESDKLEPTERAELSQEYQASTSLSPQQRNNSNPSFCHFCGFSASSVEIYHKHIKQHDKSNCTFACFICTFKYRNRQEITEHYRDIHKKNQNALKMCETCKFVTSDQQNHTDHIRNHFLIRPHACGVCYISFVTSNAYHNHMEVKHTVEERKTAGYVPRIRRRGAPISQPLEEQPQSKRTKQNSGTKATPRQRTPSNNNKSATKSAKERTYFVLPTRSIVLACSFCDAAAESKRELTLHLLATHKDELITLKPL